MEQTTKTTKMQTKSLQSPDEVRTFENGKIDIVNFDNGVTIGRATFELNTK